MKRKNPQIRGRGITADEMRSIFAGGGWKCRHDIAVVMGEVGKNPIIGPMLYKMFQYGHLERRKKNHPERQMKVWYYRMTA